MYKTSKKLDLHDIFLIPDWAAISIYYHTRLVLRLAQAKHNEELVASCRT